MTEKEKLQEVLIGRGFKEVEQTSDGIFCTACLQVHKRPSKMYSDGQRTLGNLTNTLCRYQLISYYWDPGDSDF